MEKVSHPGINEYLMRRDYQELYVRDITINALGEVSDRKDLILEVAWELIHIF